MDTRAVAFIGVASTLVAGCGGAQPKSAQVRAVVQRYETALLRGGGEALCPLLSSQAQREVAALAASLTVTPKIRGCIAFGNFLRAARAHNAGASSHLRAGRIGDVKVLGDRATALIHEPGGTSQLTLVDTAIGWRITLPSPATTPAFSLRGEPVLSVEPPESLADGGLAEFELGRSVAAQSGCLACHRIGTDGNSGPGPDLTHVGARLPALAIERAIINASAPMPSFRNLPKVKLRALVTFLSQLRG